MWAISDAGGWYALDSPPPNGSSSYSMPWGVNVPAGSYRLRVSWGVTPGVYLTRDYSDAYFTVLEP